MNYKARFLSWFKEWKAKGLRKIFSDLLFVTLSLTVFILNVRLGTETKLRESKEFEISTYKKENRVLLEANTVLKDANRVLTVNQISRAGVTEQIGLIIWIKELYSDEWKIIYVSPEYNQLLPTGLDRLNLFGRTGKFYEHAFGSIWQENDSIAWYKTGIFPEPFRWNGTGPILVGDFRKGRVETSVDRKWVFGEFIKEVKGKKADSLIEYWIRTKKIDTSLVKNLNTIGTTGLDSLRIDSLGGTRR